MGSQSEGAGSYWSIYLRLLTTETPLLTASSGGVGGGLTTVRHWLRSPLRPAVTG